MVSGFSADYDHILNYVEILHSLRHGRVLLFGLENRLIAISPCGSHRNWHGSPIQKLARLSLVRVRHVGVVELTAHWFQHHPPVEIGLIFLIGIDILHFFLPAIIGPNAIGHLQSIIGLCCLQQIILSTFLALVASVWLAVDFFLLLWLLFSLHLLF